MDLLVCPIGQTGRQGSLLWDQEKGHRRVAPMCSRHLNWYLRRPRATGSASLRFAVAAQAGPRPRMQTVIQPRDYRVEADPARHRGRLSGSHRAVCRRAARLLPASHSPRGRARDYVGLRDVCVSPRGTLLAAAHRPRAVRVADARQLSRGDERAHARARWRTGRSTGLSTGISPDWPHTREAGRLGREWCIGGLRRGHDHDFP